MFDYYEYYKIDCRAKHDEIQGALDMVYQTLQRQGGTEEQYRTLREAQETLLNPMRRAEYDQKLGIRLAKPEAESGSPTSGIKTMVVLLCVSAALAALLALYLPGKLRSAPKPAITPGVYLVSNATEKDEAVLRKFDPEHLFPEGSKKEGYEILVMASGEIEWISREELTATYRTGGYAPRELTGN